MKGGTGEFGFNVSCRAAQAKKDFERELHANPSTTEIADQYLAEHKAREERVRREEQARYQEAEDYIARKKAEARQRLQDQLISSTFDSAGATPRERDLTTQMIRSQCPDGIDKREIHLLFLGKLRELIGNV